MKKILSIVVVIMFALTGCSAVKVTPPCTYLIDRMPVYVPVKHDDTNTIMVMQPEVVPAYDTAQMAYSRCPFQVAYYVKSQWAETPPQMLQPLMVKALQCTHHYHAVVTPPFVGNYDYSLKTQIIELNQDYTSPCHPILRMKVHAQIIAMNTNDVVATKDFCINVPMRCMSPYGGVLAANIATEMFLQQLARFCITKA